MLTAAATISLKRQFDSVVGSLGVPAGWSRAKAPSPVHDVIVGFKTAGVKDTEVVNSYGINAVIMTLRASDVSVAPEKFDSFSINGIRHTADAVHTVNLGGQVIGWKIYVRGGN